MADALASGASGRNPVGVQVPPRPQAVVDPTTPVTSGHRQSTATSRASHIDRMRWSLRRPIRSISTPRDTLSIESRLTAERCRTGSSPGSRTTSLANPRIVVVHGAIRERLRRSMAMFLERMTTGRLPMSGGSHHHSSPRAGRGVTWLLLRCGTTQGRPTRPVRPGDGWCSRAGSHHRSPRARLRASRADSAFGTLERSRHRGRSSFVGGTTRALSQKSAGTLPSVGDKWKTPPVAEVRDTTVCDRAEALVDLLLLTDALPPLAHRKLETPAFRDLCDRR